MMKKHAITKKPDPKQVIFNKLARTSILTNFVKKTKGHWDHDGWLCLLSSLKEKGYDPIDPNQVGLLLEQKKALYLSR